MDENGGISGSDRDTAAAVPADPTGAERAEGVLPSSERIAAIAGRIDRPVVLVGLMGVGKSTIGRKLAQILGFSFVDADSEIEEAAQMSIADMFERFGEEHFRDGERRVIARLIGEGAPDRKVPDRTVIATGGGAFADPATRSLILERAIAVWIDSDIETLVARVGRKQTRPLLAGKDPREVLTRLRDERTPAYAEAPIHVVSDQGPQLRSVARTLRALGEHLA